MTIKNIKSGNTIVCSTGFRKNDKIVKFHGVSMKIESALFKKHWVIINE